MKSKQREKSLGMKLAKTLDPYYFLTILDHFWDLLF